MELLSQSASRVIAVMDNEIRHQKHDTYAFFGSCNDGSRWSAISKQMRPGSAVWATAH